MHLPTWVVMARGDPWRISTRTPGVGWEMGSWHEACGETRMARSKSSEGKMADTLTEPLANKPLRPSPVPRTEPISGLLERKLHPYNPKCNALPRRGGRKYTRSQRPPRSQDRAARKPAQPSQSNSATAEITTTNANTPAEKWHEHCPSKQHTSIQKMMAPRAFKPHK